MEERDLRIVKEVRIRKDITLQEVARATGLSETAISLIERGKVQPNDRTRYKIERWLDSVFSEKDNLPAILSQP